METNTTKKTNYKVWYILIALISFSAIFIAVPRKVELVNGTETNAISINIFENKKLEVLTDEHYNFVGWYDDKDQKYEEISNLLVNVKLMAKWTPKEYTIDYKLEENDKIEGQKIEKYLYNESEGYSLPKVSREHYNFVGWKNGENIIQEIPIGSDINYVLEPVFEPKTYKIEYVLNGGELKEGYTKEYKYGDKVNLPLPYKAGYLFTEWFSDEELTNGEVKYEGDITLYAGWKVKPKPAPVKTYDGDYIRIGNYSAALTNSWSQASMDAPDLAAWTTNSGKTLLGDHGNQGLLVIESFPIGGTATLKMNGVERTITLASRYEATNEKSYIQLSDGRHWGDCGDGWLVIYTCQRGSLGYNIFATYWN